MTLPVDGALYYLHHVSGNKYVHPSGGSDSPGNDTPLVFHEPNGRLALQFLFSTVNGHRQLQQYSSNKYVHPKGGHVGNDVVLVLYDGNDGARTSVDMVLLDGLPYLINGGDRSYYVHPSGGSVTPGNDTKLVYYNVHRPGISIEIVPAEDYSIESINFDQSGINNLTGTNIVVDKVISNNSDQAVTSTVELTYDRSVTNTFEFSFTEKLGVKVTTKGKTSFVFAEATVSLEVSFEFSATQTKTQSTTEGVQLKAQEVVTVPAHKSVKISLVTNRKSGKIPFVAVVVSARGHRQTLHGTMDVEYFFNQNVVVNNV
jgi:hypothetical protein